VIETLEEGVAAGAFKLAEPGEDVADLLSHLWNGQNIRLLLGYEWIPPERALRLGLGHAERLLGLPRGQLLELADREIATCNSKGASD
jgi:hypothetical protein